MAIELHSASRVLAVIAALAAIALVPTTAGALAKLARVPGPGRVARLRAVRSHGVVRITWQAAHGARLNILQIAVRGAPHYAPVFVTGTRFVSTTTLPRLGAGRTAKVTVTPVAVSGDRGRPDARHYQGDQQK